MISFEVNSFIFNAVRHLGAQVTIERYGQFTVFLDPVILLWNVSAHCKKIKPNP